jgi:hypothetical protein
MTAMSASSRFNRWVIGLILLVASSANVAELRAEPNERATAQDRASTQADPTLGLIGGVASERPIVEPAEGDATSNACRSCHPGPYESWHHSYHRTMTQLVSPDRVIPDMEDVTLEAYGNRVRLFREGDEFFVELMGVQAQDIEPGAAAASRRKIVMITGSHHWQLFWYVGDGIGNIMLLPFFYRMDKGVWMPKKSAFLTPPASHDLVMKTVSNGVWTRNCSKCHATRVRPGIVDRRAMETRVTEFGIACEACHGPGREHVEANRNPIRRYAQHFRDEPDPTIVNPARLSPKRASQVCGQCHSYNTMLTKRHKARWTFNGYEYRPGDDLEQTRAILRAGREIPAWVEEVRPDILRSRFWADGISRATGREYNDLLETACFERGELSCLDCHALHQAADDPRPVKAWADDMLSGGGDPDHGCRQCHAELVKAGSAHTHHAEGSSGSQCVNCHMTYTTYGLLKAIRTHGIKSPSAQESVSTGRPNACNQCHLDRTLAWTSEKLEAWYGLPAAKLEADDQRIAASILWVLEGDAGQRALMAWSMGWPAATETSGREWMPPFLAHLLNDGYDAVRYIAYETLRANPDYADIQYDPLGDEEGRRAVARKVLRRWLSGRESPSRRIDPSLLVDEEGGLQMDEVHRLLRRRDQRPITIIE